MNVVFVDSNVFLRFLTKDDADQSSRAKRLFQEAQKGKLRLITGPPVLFEIAWTLKVKYMASHTEIMDIIESLATTPWLEMTDKDLVEDAVNNARVSGQDFADAYIHASSLKMGVAGIATFNRKHFDNLGTELVDF